MLPGLPKNDAFSDEFQALEARKTDFNLCYSFAEYTLNKTQAIATRELEEKESPWMPNAQFGVMIISGV